MHCSHSQLLRLPDDILVTHLASRPPSLFLRLGLSTDIQDFTWPFQVAESACKSDVYIFVNVLVWCLISATLSGGHNWTVWAELLHLSSTSHAAMMSM